MTEIQRMSLRIEKSSLDPRAQRMEIQRMSLTQAVKRKRTFVNVHRYDEHSQD